MTQLVRITVSPRDPATGVVRVERFAGGGQFTPYFFDGAHWRAGVIDVPPRFRDQMGFNETGWTGGSIPTTGAIGFSPSTAAVLETLAGLYWADAPFLIETAIEAGAPVWRTTLTGTVASVEQQSGRLNFTVTDLGGPYDRPVVTGRFAGTGGLEGGVEAAQRLKRRTWGRAFNVEGRIFEKAYQIYEFGDPGFPLSGFDQLRDIGRAGSLSILPWQGSAAATLAALRGVAVPQGGGVAAPSIAMARWWTQPSVLTADIRGEVGSGYVETAPEIAGRIVAVAGAGAIGNVAAAAGLRPAVAGYHIDSDTETVANALDRLLLPLSLTWAVDTNGTARILPITLDAPIETVRSLSVTRQRTFPPMSSRRIGYQRAWRTHGEGEISSLLYASDVAFGNGTPVEVLAGVQPNATVGAPAGTYVGSMLAEEIEQTIRDIGQSTGTDTTPPGVPTGLALSSALAPGGTVDLTISWNAVADGDLSTYHLDVALAGGGFVRFNAPGTSYILHGLQPAMGVQARVRAVDDSGNASAFSATISGSTTRDTVPPAAPTALGVDTSFGGVMLNWTNPADADVVGATIFEGASTSFASAVGLTVVNTLPGQLGRFTRAGLGSGVTRYYWVRAVDSSGNASGVAGPIAATTRSVDNADLSPNLVLPGDVASLPSPVGYTGPRLVYNRADGKVYRYHAGAWTVKTDGGDLVQGSVTTLALKARSVTASVLGIAAENLIPNGQMLDGTLDGFVRITLANDGRNFINCADGGASPPSGWPSRYALRMLCFEQGNKGEISTSTGEINLDTSMTQGFPVKLGDEFLFEAVTYTSNGAVPIVELLVRTQAGQLGSFGVNLPAGQFVRQSAVLRNTIGDGVGYFRFRLGNANLTAGSAEVYWWNLYARKRNGGQLIVDGGIVTRMLAAESITGDKVKAGTFTGDIFQTGTSLPGTMTVDNTGVSIATTTDRAANPAARVNAGTTLITPGHILLAGNTALSSWLYGGDTALLDGGNVAANTIRGNALTIGLRGIQPIDISFSTNGGNIISWTAGYIEWTDEAGNRRVNTIPAGQVGFDFNNPIAVLYVWWNRNNSHLDAAMVSAAQIEADTNNVIMALYRGGTNHVVYVGRTTIEGDQIRTGTVAADRLIVNSIEGKYIKVGTLYADLFASRSITSDKIAVREIDAVHIRLNGVALENLSYGTVAEASLYSRDDTNDNDQTSFVPFMGIRVDTNDGAPIRGFYSCFVSRVSGSGECWIRVVRTIDNTVIKWGANGRRMVVPADGMFIADSFLDSVGAGITTQYEIQIRVASGTIIREEGRRLDVEEMVRHHFDELYIAARPGEGPGAGASGGGNINGDTTGRGGTGGTAATGSNAGYRGGGLRSATAQLE